MSCFENSTYDFCLEEGGAKTKSFVWRDSDDVVVDLTGKNIQLVCEESALDKNATVADPLTGEFSFSYTDSDTDNLTNGLVTRRFKYSVKDTSVPKTLFHGYIEVVGGFV